MISGLDRPFSITAKPINIIQNLPGSYIYFTKYIPVDNLFIFPKAFRADMPIFALLKNGDLDYGKCVCKYDCSKIEYC